MNYYILITGLLAVTGLSLFIRRHVRKHLGSAYSSYVHIFIIFIGLYYLIDVLRQMNKWFQSPFFYFWFAIILSQGILFVFSLKKNKIHQNE